MVVHSLDRLSDVATVLILSGDVVFELVFRHLRVDGVAPQVQSRLCDGAVGVTVDVAADFILRLRPLNDLFHLVVIDTDRADAVPAVHAEGVVEDIDRFLRFGLAFLGFSLANDGDVDLVRSGGLRERNTSSYANRVGSSTGCDKAQLSHFAQAVIHADGGYFSFRVRSGRSRTNDEDVVKAGFVGDGRVQRNVNRANPFEVAHSYVSSFITGLSLISTLVK